jgi:UDP-2,3-diacylglucosamine hydrolase
MRFKQLPNITIPDGKKIYFASDFHLGMPNHATSLQREKLICKWLDTIAADAYHIFLLGDIFDAWLEYKTAVPKGFVRLLGKLAQLRDDGILITAFTGNHDLWMYGYFEQELNIPVHHDPILVAINDKQFLLGHGDGLGPGDNGYKRLKKFLNNGACQWLYRWIHPDIGIRMAQYFSSRGIDKKQTEDKFLGEDKEYLILFCKDYLQQQQHVDYFLFGHRHYKLEFALPGNSTYINLGDWLQYNSYAMYDGNTCGLHTFTA